MEEFQPQHRVTAHFDGVAAEYFDWYRQPTPEGHSFRIRRQRCLDLLGGLPAGSRVADVGCGPATMVRDLLDRGYDVIGLDIAPKMIEDARRRFASEPRARFEVCPADTLPLPEGSMDAVLAMGLMEYLNDEESVLREIARVLRPGGLAILTYPHYFSPMRIWNRFTLLMATPFLRWIRRRGNSGQVKHREYRIAPTVGAVRRAGFDVKDVVLYNFKLAFRPLDALTPGAIVRVAGALERYCRTPVLRAIGTGFILLARRSEAPR